MATTGCTVDPLATPKKMVATNSAPSTFSTSCSDDLQHPHAIHHAHSQPGSSQLLIFRKHRLHFIC